jgi:hypothetical protein
MFIFEDWNWSGSLGAFSTVDLLLLLFLSFPCLQLSLGHFLSQDIETLFPMVVFVAIAVVLARCSNLRSNGIQ